MRIDELDLEEKVGQMFIIGLRECDVKDKLINIIQKYKIGGIVLYRKNYSDYHDMITVINTIKKANEKNKVPLFISIDQEGGRVNRMPSEIQNIKDAYNISKSGDIELVKDSGKIIGEMLKKTGINMNYAPVLDIKRFNENHAIGNRCYGDSKEEVMKYGVEVMKEMKNQGVIPVIKHFPGHGLTHKDSHYKIPTIKESIDILENEDMKPFEKAIEEGADGIMVGHLIIKDIDKKYPASLSNKIIKGYIRDKYKFNGLVITDDLKMWAIKLRFRNINAVLKAIDSGNDVIMLGYSYKSLMKVLKKVNKKARKGKIDINNIDESVKRILNIKEKYGLTDKEITGFNIDEINNRIQGINENIKKL